MTTVVLYVQANCLVIRSKHCKFERNDQKQIVGGGMQDLQTIENGFYLTSYHYTVYCVTTTIKSHFVHSTKVLWYVFL